MSDPRPTSLTLLDRARANEPDAWERLVRLYEPMVVGWCRKSGASEADSADVAQEVFSVVVSGIERFRRDREGDTFRGWLRGITRFKLLKLGERRRSGPLAKGGTDAAVSLQNLPESLPIDEDDPVEERRALYHRALDLVREEFEPKTWKAFWRTAVDGLDAPEVASELGLSPASVRQAKSRVLRRLRVELGDLLD